MNMVMIQNSHLVKADHLRKASAEVKVARKARKAAREEAKRRKRLGNGSHIPRTTQLEVNYYVQNYRLLRNRCT